MRDSQALLERLRTSDTSVSSVIDLLTELHRTAPPANWHPLGFIHCRLYDAPGEAIRLHVWPATERRPQRPLWLDHTHAFNLQSHVLVGALSNCELDVNETGPTRTQRRVFVVRYDESSSVLERTSRTVYIVGRRRTVHTQGARYAVSPGVFHRTVVASGTPAVTLVRATEVRATPPFVLGSLYGEREYRYDRTVCTPQEWRDAIQSVLRYVQCA